MSKAENLSAASDEDLSLWIAAKNESSTNFVHTCRTSERLWWDRRYFNKEWIVTPRSINDPEIFLRLLKLLLKQGGWCISDLCKPCCDDKKLPERAVAEQWARTNGWGV